MKVPLGSLLAISLLGIAVAEENDQSQPDRPSHHLDGVVHCDSETMECKVSCGKDNKAECKASAMENQFRLKIDKYRIKCSNQKCSVHCTRDTPHCFFVGTKKYDQLHVDQVDYDFGSALDSAAKIITDYKNGYLKDSFKVL